MPAVKDSGTHTVKGRKIGDLCALPAPNRPLRTTSFACARHKPFPRPPDDALHCWSEKVSLPRASVPGASAMDEISEREALAQPGRGTCKVNAKGTGFRERSASSLPQRRTLLRRARAEKEDPLQRAEPQVIPRKGIQGIRAGWTAFPKALHCSSSQAGGEIVRVDCCRNGSTDLSDSR